MANEINENGITVDSFNETYDNLVQNFKDIYGQDINLEQSTPDGQIIGIAAQAKTDTLELAVRQYNMFNPDTVSGVQQDNLYRLVGLKRKATQFSFVEVDVVTTGSCTLQGLDDKVEDLNATGYMVSDTIGNNWILTETTYINQAGTYSLNFRAQNQGAISCLPNTITNMVTVVGNVASVNNAAIQYITGQAEETDAQFRNRFYQSRAFGSTGTSDGLTSKLLNLNLVTGAFVYNNRGSSTDSTGTAGHTVWTIVEGGSTEDIGNLLYANLTDGCGMRGSVTYSITNEAGLTQTIKFDRPTYTPIYVTVSIKNKGSGTVDQTALKEYIVNNLVTGIYTSVDTAMISNIIQSYDSNLIPYDLTVGESSPTSDEYILPSNYNVKYTLDVANISITTVTNV
jgi:hypothetical protein